MLHEKCAGGKAVSRLNSTVSAHKLVHTYVWRFKPFNNLSMTFFRPRSASLRVSNHCLHTPAAISCDQTGAADAQWNVTLSNKALYLRSYIAACERGGFSYRTV